MNDVRVHYNSTQPDQLQALAYTQGSEIHIGAGQERHLPHEAWHVVQQMQGRVQRTIQAQGIAINDDAGLEAEAEHMGRRADAFRRPIQAKAMPVSVSAARPVGNGSYKIIAGMGQHPVGSVMVHDQNERAIEVTDLVLSQPIASRILAAS